MRRGPVGAERSFQRQRKEGCAGEVDIKSEDSQFHRREPNRTERRRIRRELHEKDGRRFFEALEKASSGPNEKGEKKSSI